LTLNPEGFTIRGMQKSEKFFIFTWKELTVIGLLMLITLSFFFTLGLHYGKKLHGEVARESATEKLEQSPEAVPSKETLEEGSKHAEGATQDSIRAATEDEISHSGIKVEQPKAVDLPGDKADAPAVHAKLPMRAANDHGGDVAAENAATKAAEAKPADDETLEPIAETHGRFAIQLGSYPNKKEAQLKITSLMKRGLHPEVRTAVVNEQTRYRVVLPGFKTKAAADGRGKDLHSKRKIENFIVIKSE
jgi:cell division protein FtsN